MITTTRVFCSFLQTNIKEYPNSEQSDLQPYHSCGNPGPRPLNPLTAHTPRQPTIYLLPLFSNFNLVITSIVLSCMGATLYPLVLPLTPIGYIYNLFMLCIHYSIKAQDLKWSFIKSIFPHFIYKNQFQIFLCGPF